MSLHFVFLKGIKKNDIKPGYNLDNKDGVGIYFSTGIVSIQNLNLVALFHRFL